MRQGLSQSQELTDSSSLQVSGIYSSPLNSGVTGTATCCHASLLQECQGSELRPQSPHRQVHGKRFTLYRAHAPSSPFLPLTASTFSAPRTGDTVWITLCKGSNMERLSGLWQESIKARNSLRAQVVSQQSQPSEEGR